MDRQLPGVRLRPPRETVTTVARQAMPVRAGGAVAGEAMVQFLEHCQRRRYPARATILRQGAPPDQLCYVTSGSVTVMLEDEEGREVVLAYLNPGDFFGEIGLFSQTLKRGAMVRARSACEVASIPYEALRALPAIFPHVLFAIASQLAQRLRNTNSKVRDLVFLDVSGRVARALLELCRQPDAMTHPDGTQLSVTRQELGRIVGCSREMAGRVLKSLEEQHLIAVRGKTIVVLGAR